MRDSPPPEQPRAVLPYFFLLGALEALGALGYLLSIPADPKNSLLFGYSLARLGLAAVLLICMLAFAGFAAFFWHRPGLPGFLTDRLYDRRTRLAGLFLVAFLGLLVSWVVIFLPGYRLKTFNATFTRLLPFLAWLGLVSLQGSLALLLGAYVRFPQRLSTTAGPTRPILRSAAMALSILLAAWLLIAVTGIGIRPVSGFWNKTGVPLLGFQIGLAWAAGTLALLLTNRFRPRRSKGRRSLWLDAALCIGLWALAAVLWNRAPYPASNFNSAAYPPNYQSYPLSDARSYDLSAQSIIAGFGIFRTIVDKPLHSTFLAVLHLLAGQDYLELVSLQVAALAVIAPLLYLLGKSLHSRTLGVMVAVLGIFTELNALALTNIIMVSNVKMLLSEMLTMAGMLLFTWLLAQGLKHLPANPLALFASAGVLGLTMLIRLNPVFILPLVVLAAWASLPSYRARLGISVVLIALVAAPMLPWMVRNGLKYHNPLVSITGKTQGVIIANRYTPLLNQPEQAETGGEPVPLPEAAPLPIQTVQPGAEARPAASAGLAKIARLGSLAVQHYVHNLVATVLMIPPVLTHETLPQVVRAPYWDVKWTGSFLPGGQVLLVIILALAALGIGACWSRWKLAGLAPLITFLGYHLANGLALTSGGRYIVPVDWAVYFYVAAGIMELTVWGTALLGLRLDPLPAWQQPHERPAWQWTGFARRAGLSIMAFVILGSFIPLFELAFPRPPTRSQQDLAAVLQQGSLLAGTSLAGDGLARYLQQPGAVLLEGNSLYPRFYAAGQGDMIDGGEPRAVKDFPRLAFTLQRSSAAAVLLPFAQAPAGLPSGTPVIVLGCKKSGEIRARAVLLTGTGQLLLSNDNPAAGCP